MKRLEEWFEERWVLGLTVCDRVVENELLTWIAAVAGQDVR